jgi:alcohol dehydrogenase (cytochrome c)
MGDNLYTCSLVALDARTGKLRWHFQFTPHDVNDWDSTHVPMLVDEGGRKLVLVANRNGFYYVLDRVTGEFLKGAEYGKQTWSSGLDAKGRPARLAGVEPTPEGTMVYPGFHGVTNWFSPSYSPQTKLVYVAVREEPAVFSKQREAYVPGQWWSGGNPRGVAKVEPTGSIRALEHNTGKMVWEFPLKSPPWAGLMATAGGVVFGGSSEGAFYALDASAGKPLWHYNTGGPIFANPISFQVEGRQYIAIAAGNALFASPCRSSGLPHTHPTLTPVTLACICDRVLAKGVSNVESAASHMAQVLRLAGPESCGSHTSRLFRTVSTV